MILPTAGPVTTPALLISPEIATSIAKGGYSKQDVKRYVFDHARVPAHQLEEFLARKRVFPKTKPGEYGNESAEPTCCELVRLGRLPKIFCESEDPNRLIPVVTRPEEYMVVVTGLATRNRNRIIRQGGHHGRRIQGK